MFGLKLKHSKFIEGTDWDYIATFSKSAADPANYLQNEFVGLVDKAQKLYGPKTKKKKKKKS
jgi:hypothetical protein